MEIIYHPLFPLFLAPLSGDSLVHGQKSKQIIYHALAAFGFQLMSIVFNSKGAFNNKRQPNSFNLTLVRNCSAPLLILYSKIAFRWFEGQPSAWKPYDANWKTKENLWKSFEKQKKTYENHYNEVGAWKIIETISNQLKKQMKTFGTHLKNKANHVKTMVTVWNQQKKTLGNHLKYKRNHLKTIEMKLTPGKSLKPQKINWKTKKNHWKSFKKHQETLEVIWKTIENLWKRLKTYEIN